MNAMNEQTMMDDQARRIPMRIRRAAAVAAPAPAQAPVIAIVAAVLALVTKADEEPERWDGMS